VLKARNIKHLFRRLRHGNALEKFSVLPGGALRGTAIYFRLWDLSHTTTSVITTDYKHTE